MEDFSSIIGIVVFAASIAISYIGSRQKQKQAGGPRPHEEAWPAGAEALPADEVRPGRVEARPGRVEAQTAGRHRAGSAAEAHGRAGAPAHGTVKRADGRRDDAAGTFAERARRRMTELEAELARSLETEFRTAEGGLRGEQARQAAGTHGNKARTAGKKGAGGHPEGADGRQTARPRAQSRSAEAGHASAADAVKSAEIGREEEAATPQEFDLRQAVVYAEILKPKFEEDE